MEGTALEWFESYFSGRTQTFYVADASSRPVPLICGVPQGSILGPTVFVAYTEEIQTYLTLIYHLYADDTQLLACCPVFDIDICRHSIESNIIQISKECSSRRLQLNPEKTELIWFGSAANLSRLENASLDIHVGQVTIKPVDVVRDLGVMLDSRLDMRQHISKTVSACFFHLRRLRQMKRILDRDMRQRLVSTFIISRIDYCNVALAGLPATSLAPLQRVLNAAARFVADIGPFDHITSTLQELHWLPINQRIVHKLCTLMHLSTYGVVPQYIRDVLTPTSALSRRADLRSAERMEYDVPFARTMMGMRGFSVAGPSAWNRLPIELRQISTYSTFRRNLKTHLFKKSYGLD